MHALLPVVIAHGAYRAIAGIISIHLFSSTIQYRGSVSSKSGYCEIASVQSRDSVFISKQKRVHSQLCDWPHAVAIDRHIGSILARLYRGYKSRTGFHTLGGFCTVLSRVEA